MTRTRCPSKAAARARVSPARSALPGWRRSRAAPPPRTPPTSAPRCSFRRRADRRGSTRWSPSGASRRRYRACEACSPWCRSPRRWSRRRARRGRTNPAVTVVTVQGSDRARGHVRHGAARSGWPTRSARHRTRGHLGWFAELRWRPPSPLREAGRDRSGRARGAQMSATKTLRPSRRCPPSARRAGPGPEDPAVAGAHPRNRAIAEVGYPQVRPVETVRSRGAADRRVPEESAPCDVHNWLRDGAPARPLERAVHRPREERRHLEARHSLVGRIGRRRRSGRDPQVEDLQHERAEVGSGSRRRGRSRAPPLAGLRPPPRGARTPPPPGPATARDAASEPRQLFRQVQRDPEGDAVRAGDPGLRRGAERE